MSTRTPTAPYELLDDGYAPPPCDLLVLGCGNILRGDDAVGPIVVRHLFQRGVPDGVRIIDGGTAGMDVAFAMRGAKRVVIVDAARTGAEAGTVYRVPAEQLTDLPPLDGLHSHNFRWDHALSFASWLLGPLRPTDITVFLIEGSAFNHGEPLTRAVEAAAQQVADLIETDFYPAAAEGTEPEPALWGDITDNGYLHLPHDVARQYFPADVALAQVDDHQLVLLPLMSPANGGLLLKQRNAAGDRSVLVYEALQWSPTPGAYPLTWNDERGALEVHLHWRADGPTRPSGDSSRKRSVGGVPVRDHPRGRGTPAPVDPSSPSAGAGGGPGHSAHGEPAPAATRRAVPVHRAVPSRPDAGDAAAAGRTEQ